MKGLFDRIKNQKPRPMGQKPKISVIHRRCAISVSYDNILRSHSTPFKSPQYAVTIGRRRYCAVQGSRFKVQNHHSGELLAATAYCNCLLPLPTAHFNSVFHIQSKQPYVPDFFLLLLWNIIENLKYSFKILRTWLKVVPDKNPELLRGLQRSIKSNFSTSINQTCFTKNHSLYEPRRNYCRIKIT